jgi:hypothetical protein
MQCCGRCSAVEEMHPLGAVGLGLGIGFAQLLHPQPRRRKRGKVFRRPQEKGGEVFRRPHRDPHRRRTTAAPPHPRHTPTALRTNSAPPHLLHPTGGAGGGRGEQGGRGRRRLTRARGRRPRRRPRPCRCRHRRLDRRCLDRCRCAARELAGAGRRRRGRPVLGQRAHGRHAQVTNCTIKQAGARAPRAGGRAHSNYTKNQAHARARCAGGAVGF